MRRVLLIVLGIPVVLVILAAILVPLLVDKDKILSFATQQLEQQTGATLAVGGEVSLSLFPTLGIALEDAALTLPGEEEAAIRAQALAIGVAVGPLLSGQVEVGAIRIDSLDATLRQVPAAPAPEAPPQGERPQVDERPAPTPGPAEPAAGAQPSSPASVPAIRIDEVEVLNSSIALVDAEGVETRIQIERLLAESVNLAGDPVSVDGAVQLPEQDLAVELAGNLRLALESGDLNLEGLQIKVAGMTPEPLTVDTLGNINYDAAGGTVDLRELQLILSGATPDPLQLNAKGEVGLDPLDADLALDIQSGTAKGQATLAYREPGPGGKSITLDTAGDVGGLDLALLLGLAGVDQDLTGIADASWTLEGAGVDQEALIASIAGPLSVSLAGGSYQGQALAMSAEGRIDLTREFADVKLDAALGEVTAKGSVRYAGTASPQIDAKLHMNLLDPALLALAGPEAAAEAEQVDAAASTGDEPLPLEPLRAIDTRAEITVDEARYENYAAQNVKLKLRANKGIVRVTSFTGEAYSGKLDMQATLNAAEDEARFNSKGNIKGVQIAQLLAALETEPMLEGKANLDWQLNSRGTTANQLFEALNGPIKLRANKSVLKGIGIEKELCSAVALVNQAKMQNELPADSTFRKLGIDMRMSEGRAILKPISAQLAGAGVTGEGAVDLLQEEFRVTFKAKLSPALGKLDPACEVNERYTGLEWPLDCRGALSGEPADWCSVETGDIIADLARNEAQRKIQKEAGRALEKLFDRN
ncbi:MAG: AsmA family protein [Pseudomonadota bacterium]